MNYKCESTNNYIVPDASTYLVVNAFKDHVSHDSQSVFSGKIEAHSDDTVLFVKICDHCGEVAPGAVYILLRKERTVVYEKEVLILPEKLGYAFFVNSCRSTIANFGSPYNSLEEVLKELFKINKRLIIDVETSFDLEKEIAVPKNCILNTSSYRSKVLARLAQKSNGRCGKSSPCYFWIDCCRVLNPSLKIALQNSESVYYSDSTLVFLVKAQSYSADYLVEVEIRYTAADSPYSLLDTEKRTKEVKTKSVEGSANSCESELSAPKSKCMERNGREYGKAREKNHKEHFVDVGSSVSRRGGLVQSYSVFFYNNLKSSNKLSDYAFNVNVEQCAIAYYHTRNVDELRRALFILSREQFYRNNRMTISDEIKRLATYYVAIRNRKYVRTNNVLRYLRPKIVRLRTFEEVYTDELREIPPNMSWLSNEHSYLVYDGSLYVIAPYDRKEASAYCERTGAILIRLSSPVCAELMVEDGAICGESLKKIINDLGMELELEKKTNLERQQQSFS